MSEATATAESTEAETSTEVEADTSAEATSEAQTEQQSTDGEAALGDAGKKALDAMKAKWKDAEKQARENAAALAALQAKVEGKEAEHEAEQKARELERAALEKANERILKAEVRVQAATKLADPADALLHIDLSEFEVDSDGGVDADAIAAAIDDLVARKPYLAAQGGKRFQGTADGGARNDASKPSQLTRADLARMSAEEIAEAEAAGRFDGVLGRT